MTEQEGFTKKSLVPTVVLFSSLGMTRESSAHRSVITRPRKEGTVVKVFIECVICKSRFVYRIGKTKEYTHYCCDQCGTCFQIRRQEVCPAVVDRRNEEE